MTGTLGAGRFFGGAREAVAFLTVFGGARAPTPGALRWFPAVGIALGTGLGVVWVGAAEVLPASVAAAVVVLADLGATGMLHADGLVDTADGLLPPLPRERRLAVMSTPDVGAFGVAVAVGVLLLRWSALASLGPSIVLLAAVWCGSRSLLAVATRVVPSARPTGLTSAFSGGGRPVAGVLGLAAALGLATWWRVLGGPASVALGLAAGLGVVLLGRRRLGGITGDVLGCAAVITETVALAAASGGW